VKEMADGVMLPFKKQVITNRLIVRMTGELKLFKRHLKPHQTKTVRVVRMTGQTMVSRKLSRFKRLQKRKTNRKALLKVMVLAMMIFKKQSQ
jgi:hypothetical protein